MTEPTPKKICTECQHEFPATTEHFHKSKLGKYGLRSKCKTCEKFIYNKDEYNHQYYKEHRKEQVALHRSPEYRERQNTRRRERRASDPEYAERARKQSNESRERHRDTRLAYLRKYYEENREEHLAKKAERWKNDPEYRESRRQYRKDNRERVNELQRKARQKDPERFAKYDQKRLADPKYKISRRVSAGIYHSLRHGSGKNGNHWETLVDFTINELMEHLESLFTVGMSWDNYGAGRTKWCIDHVRPIASFNFSSSDDPEFKECWCLPNLQPLWWTENNEKHASYQIPA